VIFVFSTSDYITVHGFVAFPRHNDNIQFSTRNVSTQDITHAHKMCESERNVYRHGVVFPGTTVPRINAYPNPSLSLVSSPPPVARPVVAETRIDRNQSNSFVPSVQCVGCLILVSMAVFAFVVVTVIALLGFIGAISNHFQHEKQASSYFGMGEAIKGEFKKVNTVMEEMSDSNYRNNKQSNENFKIMNTKFAEKDEQVLKLSNDNAELKKSVFSLYAQVEKLSADFESRHVLISDTPYDDKSYNGLAVSNFDQSNHRKNTGRNSRTYWRDDQGENTDRFSVDYAPTPIDATNHAKPRVYTQKIVEKNDDSWMKCGFYAMLGTIMCGGVAVIYLSAMGAAINRDAGL